ncbi:hypothetical protein QBZ16_002634 [Prototheca wickerhamii]|uniref:Uncharacterized protein n=1 Tax=Prototheca wickerhamii TaxID=3111 RepID=A0AAD9MHQ7_PROWI|nr:hypothetical protein QBZ16_002634 [Prototheca wickerhamii]
MASILATGMIVTAILDTMRQKEGAFGAAWATLALAFLAAVAGPLFMESRRSLLLCLVILGVALATLVLTGVWITLQFRWIQLQYPVLTAGLEKTLVTGSFPVALGVQGWALSELAGAEAAPFALVALGCGLLASSGGRGGARAATLQLPDEAALAFFMACTLPAGTFVASHSSAALLLRPANAWSLVILASAPALALAALLRDGLWWLGAGERVRRVRVAALLVSLAALLAGLEARVIFFSYGQYVPLAPPWNYVAVTLAVYGVGALALLHAAGALSEALERTALGPVVMTGAALGALALGLPLWVLPAPLGAAAGLAVFYDTRRFGDYLVFALGAELSAVWLVVHHFWFLEVQLAGIALRTLCVGGLAGVAAAAEQVLVAGVRGDEAAALTHGLQPLYPRWLVLATSLAGLALAARTREAAWMRPWCTYALVSLYASKLVLAVLPMPGLLLPALGLGLVALAPVLLWAAPAADRTMALLAAAIAAVVFARFAVFDVLRVLDRRRPSEALLIGTLLSIFVAILAPFVARWRPQDRRARRALLLVAGLALLLLTLRPPLPTAGGALCPPGLPLGLCPRLWDEGHVPAHERDAVGVWGPGLRRGTHAPLWLLVAAAWLGLAAWTGDGRGDAPAAAMRGPSASITASTALLGLYVAAEHGHGVRSSRPSRSPPPCCWARSWRPCARGRRRARALPRAGLVRPLPARLPRGAVGGRDRVRRRRGRGPARDAPLPPTRRRTRRSSARWACAPRCLWSGPRRRPSRRWRSSCVPSGRGGPRGARPGGRLAAAEEAEDARLEAAGLAWAPSAANAAVLVCAGCCAALGALGLRGAGPAGGALVAPVFLLLSRDQAACAWLAAGTRRRYLAPALVALASLNAGAALGHADAVRGLGDVADLVRDLAAAGLLLMPQLALLAALAVDARRGGPRGPLSLAADLLAVPQGLVGLLGACLAAAAAAAAQELVLLAALVFGGLAIVGLEEYRARRQLDATI